MDIFNIDTMSAADKISRAKVALFRKTPFFSYIVEHLRFEPDIRKELPMDTMGVDKNGRCVYTEKFVKDLPIDQLIGVVAHEGIHVAMEHIYRGTGRNIMVNGISVWNLAIDAIDNYLLLQNAFSLPENCILPADNQVKIFDKTITDISEKSAEDIYEELKVELQEMLKDGRAKEVGCPGPGKKGTGRSGQYTSKTNPKKGFDEHMKGKDGEEETPGKSGNNGKDWGKILEEAYTYAKLAGKEPAGMARMFDHLQKPRIKWRTLLRRTIATKIPFDFTYHRPNKKYMGLDTYCQDIFMPSTIGESIKIITTIDTSGSMSQEELALAVTEMIGISRSFSNVDFRILTHDVEVHDDIKIYNGNVNKIKQIQLHGGGGTSHIPLYKYIEDKKMRRQTKLLVSFTDGYSEYPDKRPGVDTIFVLVGNHVPPSQMPKWGVTVLLD